MKSVFKDTVEKIIIKTITDYAKLYDNRQREIFNPTKKLIFPLYRVETGKNERLSEKEAHFLFSLNLENYPIENLYYSVETPTQYRYRFINKFFSEYPFNHLNGRSALLDFCIYKGDALSQDKFCNIEFKYGNGRIASFAKDIYKLLLEEVDGYLIILLEKMDLSTLWASKSEKGILIKLKEILFSYRKYFRDETDLNIFIADADRNRIYLLTFNKGNLKKMLSNLRDRSNNKLEEYVCLIS